MNESTTDVRYSSHASLAALGALLRSKDLFGPISTYVRIAQKSIKRTPVEKLQDAFVTLLAGAHGLVEINTLLRSDPALQHAFGRSSCADQSVVQQTLSAATADNVSQMQAACRQIYREHSLGYQHDYQARCQVLDADMTGNPCGKKAEFASKGYFAKERNRRGRQIGRILATLYQEVVTDQLFDGKKQLPQTLIGLIGDADQTLGLDSAKRARTIIRVDGGGGSLDDVNELLGQGYLFHGKDYSTIKAQRLAESVKRWYPDPRISGREVGLVTEPANEYARPVRRIAVRCRKDNGQWGIGVLISVVPPKEVFAQIGKPFTHARKEQLLADVYFYDDRGGGIETSFKGDKQGLGMTHRNKHSFTGQQMLQWLTALAHNVLIWAKQWLLPDVPAIKTYGIMRTVRDILRISGRIEHIEQKTSSIVLNQRAPLAQQIAQAFDNLLKPWHVTVSWGET
jgi:hypothetical protein